MVYEVCWCFLTISYAFWRFLVLSDDFSNLLDSSPLNINVTVSEWLRRWTRNPLGSARVGSNPTGVDFTSSLVLLY